MKKFLVFFVVIALAGSIFSSASLAGRSELIDEEELNQIGNFARNAYNWKGGFSMTVGDEWPLGRYFVIEFRGRHGWQYISLTVYPAEVVFRDRNIGHQEMAGACEKIEQYIKKILNAPAREALK